MISLWIAMIKFFWGGSRFLNANKYCKWSFLCVPYWWLFLVLNIWKLIKVLHTLKNEDEIRYYFEIVSRMLTERDHCIDKLLFEIIHFCREVYNYHINQMDRTYPNVYLPMLYVVDKPKSYYHDLDHHDKACLR